MAGTYRDALRLTRLGRCAEPARLTCRPSSEIGVRRGGRVAWSSGKSVVRRLARSDSARAAPAPSSGRHHPCPARGARLGELIADTGGHGVDEIRASCNAPVCPASTRLVRGCHRTSRARVEVRCRPRGARACRRADSCRRCPAARSGFRRVCRRACAGWATRSTARCNRQRSAVGNASARCYRRIGAASGRSAKSIEES
jgi:hypothetical protein